ncbi:MAG TPA: dienelactone hydrolase family protein [Pseudobdellovibrionaceae bacterium]|jgi:dienelactone hydrolase
MKNMFISFFIFLGGLVVKAEVKTEVVEYKQDGTTLEGFLAYDPSFKGPHSAILIVHEWTGLGDYVKGRAKELAAKGYVAFALDIYGKGVRPALPKEAAKEAGKYKENRKLMRERAKAGYDFIKAQPFVDSSKIIAMGYCFGGTVALEMGRSGLPLAGVVSFHGGLATPTPQDAKNFKAKLLVLHGAIDPYTKDEVPGFQKEMDEARVDYQLISYGGTVHAFTNPQAGNDIKTGAAYNALSDRRSMQAFMGFLNEVAPIGKAATH